MRKSKPLREAGISQGRTSANTAAGLHELLAQVETLQRERDQYATDLYVEKQKNAELEKEFHVLRELISSVGRPVGAEENMMLRNQYVHEKELRIQADSDL